MKHRKAESFAQSTQPDTELGHHKQGLDVESHHTTEKEGLKIRGVCLLLNFFTATKAVLSILNVASATSPFERAEAAPEQPRSPPPSSNPRPPLSPHHVVSGLHLPGTLNFTDSTPRGDP